MQQNHSTARARRRDIDIDAQIRCVEREIGFRERGFARRVEAGRMTQEKADYEIAAMRAVLESPHRPKGLER